MPLYLTYLKIIPLILFPFKDYNSKNQEVYVMVVSVMNKELFIEVHVTLKEFSISIQDFNSFL